MPSPVGIRIAPRIGDELRQKAAKAAAAKASKGKKVGPEICCFLENLAVYCFACIVRTNFRIGSKSCGLTEGSGGGLHG